MDAYIKTLQNYNKSEIIYPVTKAGAVYMDDNSATIQDVLQDVATKEYVDEKATWEALPDKPFYKGDETTVLNGVTFSFGPWQASDDAAYYVQNASIALVAGKSYRVDVNGTQLIGTAVSGTLNGNDAIYLGNLSLANQGEDTGEVFLVSYFPDFSVGYIYVRRDFVGGSDFTSYYSAVVSLYQFDLVKLPEEFLPNTVATKEYVDEAVANAIGAVIGGSY